LSANQVPELSKTPEHTPPRSDLKNEARASSIRGGKLSQNGEESRPRQGQRGSRGSRRPGPREIPEPPTGSSPRPEERRGHSKPKQTPSSSNYGAYCAQTTGPAQLSDAQLQPTPNWPSLVQSSGPTDQLKRNLYLGRVRPGMRISHKGNKEGTRHAKTTDGVPRGGGRGRQRR